MSYAKLEEQIRALPEEYLDEVSRYVEFVLFRYEQRKPKSEKEDLGQFFGSLSNLSDGMDFQRRVRDEWD